MTNRLYRSVLMTFRQDRDDSRFREYSWNRHLRMLCTDSYSGHSIVSIPLALKIATIAADHQKLDIDPPQLFQDWMVILARKGFSYSVLSCVQRPAHD